MQQTSAAFRAAIRTSHNIAVKMEIVSKGNVIYTTEQIEGQPLPAARIIDGQVTMAKGSAFRSQSSVKIVDPTMGLVPTTNTSILTPWGNEIRLYRGVAFADGTKEYVQLCSNRISRVETNDEGGAVTITVTGFSRERIVARNVATSPWPTSSTPGYPLTSTAYTDYIRTLISDRYPGALFDADAAVWLGYQNDRNVTTSALAPPWLTENADPMKQCQSMAEAVGCDLYATRQGIFRLIPDPNLALMDGTNIPQPVASFEEGEEAVFLSIKSILADDNTFNQVIVTGEGQNFGLPLRSSPAIDNDPLSPTNIASDYGIVTKMETNSLMVSQLQVNNFAQLLLRRSIGGSQSIEMPIIVDPALDVDDCILGTRERLGLSSTLYVLDSVTIPLRSDGTMQVKTRERRALS